MPVQVKSAFTETDSYPSRRRSAFPVALLFTAMGLCACGPDNQAEVTELAENFLADVRVGAWNAATSRMHRDMREACGSVTGLEQKVVAANLRPQTWTFTEISAFNHTGLVQALITSSDGVERYAELAVARDDGEFRILSWRTDAQGLCGES